MSERTTAVIDIGSNSVRLVVFAGTLRAPLPKFNEKVLCGLGKDMSRTRLLSDEAMDQALKALRRYTTLIRHMRVERVMVAATAAVREADNGPEFVALVERECDFNVQVLSGRQEARYAGFGVISGIPKAYGLVGDLGGGSLELAHVNDGTIEQTATLPLGALRLSRMSASEDELKAHMVSHFDTVDWLREIRGGKFYVVGGAWRSLARYHMEKTGYPLHIIQNYKLPYAEIKNLLVEILDDESFKQGHFPGVSKVRAKTLRPAALIMRILLRIIEPKTIVFSSCGLREGMLFADLKKNDRDLDPLMEACQEMAGREGRFREHGREIYDWLYPILPPENAKALRVSLAACTLSDIAWWVNPDYRAAQAFRRIIRAPFTGIGHKSRAIMALAVYARYKGDIIGHATSEGMDLVNESYQNDALSLGLALRLAHTLSGGTYGILQKTRLRIRKDELILEIPDEWSSLLGLHVSKRLKALAEALKLQPQIQITQDELI